MVLVPNNQDLTASSGLIDSSFLEQVYHSIIDETFMDLARTVTFHLDPEIEQSTETQGQPQAQQYNPFFGRSAVPNNTTRNPGVKITHRDVEYDAHIRVGPLKNEEDLHGIGTLLDNEAMITVVIEALEHVQAAHSVSIEGRRYSIVENRPIGFSVRRYLMVKLEERQELEHGSPDNTIG